MVAADAVSGAVSSPVSYTHLDVYKRQLTPILLEYTGNALLIMTSPRFSAKYGSWAFLWSSSPTMVCSFSFHCCSICIRAHWRLQKIKCWIPDSMRKSSSLYSIISSPILQLSPESDPYGRQPCNPRIFWDTPHPHSFLLPRHQRVCTQDNLPVPYCV